MVNNSTPLVIFPPVENAPLTDWKLNLLYFHVLSTGRNTVSQVADCIPNSQP